MKSENLTPGQYFQFAEKCSYLIEGIDANKKRSCNGKVFKCLSNNIGLVAVEMKSKNGVLEFTEKNQPIETEFLLQSFIHGRGFNKHLYNVDVIIVKYDVNFK